MQTSSVTLRVPLSISEADAELLLAVKLFETNKLSLGQAAELSGYSYRAFLEVLRKNKIPVVNYPASELEKELASWNPQ
jgi:predicted HTH domain antitoxin